MAKEWTPIRRGEPRVLGVDREYSGLLNIDIPLEPTPPEGWADIFRSPPGVGISVSMHPPEINGRTISIKPPDDEVKKYITHIDERIAAVNQFYEAQVLPELRRRAERQAEGEAERKRRIEEAQRQIEEMDDGTQED